MASRRLLALLRRRLELSPLPRTDVIWLSLDLELIDLASGVARLPTRPAVNVAHVGLA